jgi:hypothetical protein
MTLFLFLTGLLFIAAIAFFVAFPLFTPEAAREPQQAGDTQVARWEKQKTDAYAAIKEAEFDLQMGKLTLEDYQALREKYETRALEALAHLDELTKASGKANEQERESMANGA